MRPRPAALPAPGEARDRGRGRSAARHVLTCRLSTLRVLHRIVLAPAMADRVPPGWAATSRPPAPRAHDGAQTHSGQVTGGGGPRDADERLSAQPPVRLPPERRGPAGVLGVHEPQRFVRHPPVLPEAAGAVATEKAGPASTRTGPV